jgi:hypothetical protein
MQEKKYMRLKVVTEISLEFEMFTNLMVNALEGGSNYWYYFPKESYDEVKRLYDLNAEPLQSRRTRAMSEKFAWVLWNCRSHSFAINDAEDHDETLGYISWDTCKKALRKLHDDYHDYYYQVMTEKDDADTADVFFQLATLGEVTFG